MLRPAASGPSAERDGTPEVRSYEHRAVGDAVAAGALVDLTGPEGGGRFSLTYGDVVALSADYFPPDAGEGGLFSMAAVPGRAGTRPGSRDELVCALHVAALDEGRPDDRFARGGPFARFRFGREAGCSEVERRVRDRYLALAAANDDHFVAPGRSDEVTRSGAPSAPAAYRRLHEVALDHAWAAGRSGADLTAVMAREAAAQHYLTDAFSAGHLRTPVAEIRRYWRARYPDFWNQLQRKVAAETARALQELSGLIRLLPAGFVVDRTRAELTRRTGRYPELSVGDLVARVFHDWDNAHGLAVDGGLVFGDGHVEEGATMTLALAAARAGIDDMEVAHRLGASGVRAGGHGLYRMVRDATGAGDRFRAEALVPRLSPANPAQNWCAVSVEELWTAPIVGAGGPTVGQALEEMLAPGGAFIRQVDALGQGLAGEHGVFRVPVLGAWLAGRCCHAFHVGFVEPLAREPEDAILSLVPRSRSPGSASGPAEGRGGQSKANAGGRMTTTTAAQRANTGR